METSNQCLSSILITSTIKAINMIKYKRYIITLIFIERMFMQKLDCKEDVLYALKNNEIVISIVQGKPCYFAQIQENLLRVNSEQLNMKITYDMFYELYLNAPFYLYEVSKKEEVINEEKDEEYYRLWHK